MNGQQFEELIEEIKRLEPYDLCKSYYRFPFGAERTYAKAAFNLIRERHISVQGIDNLLEDQKKRVSNVVRDKIRKHEKASLVRHRVLPEGAPPDFLSLIPHVEDELRGIFALRDCVVVDISELPPLAQEIQEVPDAWFRRDDEAHKRLGMWAGRVLASVIRRNDVVGVGTGRGPYYTIEACRVPPQTGHRPKEIASLTGRMAVGEWTKSETDIDADNLVQTLHSKLRVDQGPRLANCSIARERPNVLNVGDVNVAIIGIGALGGGHHLIKYGQKNPDLAAAKDEIERMTALAKKVDPKVSGFGPFRHWVGDLCNHLFVVDATCDGESTLSEKDRKDLKDAVDAVNAKFVKTSPETFANTICEKNNGIVFAVAGGPHKVSAIYHVLKMNQTKPLITHLATDSDTATHLIELNRRMSGDRFQIHEPSSQEPHIGDDAKQVGKRRKQRARGSKAKR